MPGKTSFNARPGGGAGGEKTPVKVPAETRVVEIAPDTFVCVRLATVERRESPGERTVLAWDHPTEADIAAACQALLAHKVVHERGLIDAIRQSLSPQPGGQPEA
jgi:hypothetical protein